MPPRRTIDQAGPATPATQTTTGDQDTVRLLSGGRSGGRQADRATWGAVPADRHLRHEALLTLARKVHMAAVDDDGARLEQAAARLLDALEAHVADETLALSRLAPAEARLLSRGQRRLLATTAGLRSDAAAGCPDTTRRCVVRADELVAGLYLQARDERMAWQDPAA